MTERDKIAAELRAAYADFGGLSAVPWRKAEADKKGAWRAIAERAIKLGARA
jgi:hypothetical protein